MRVTTLFPILALAAAQRPQESHEASVWDAYQNFRVSSDTFVFDMSGTELIGKDKVPVHSVLYWRNSVDPRTGLKSRAQVDLYTYQWTSTGEVPVMRIVGDGTTLLRYDLRRRTVSSTVYGFYGERAPEGYFTNVKSDAPKLAAQLRAATPGSATYLARLVAEINLASGVDFGPHFTSWSPGARPLYFDEVPLGARSLNGEPTTDDTVTDPITGRVFLRGADQFLFYGMDQRAPNRTVAFRIYDADGDASNGTELWEVESVNIAFQSPGRLVDLTITPQTGTIPNGVFVPYTGSQGAMFTPASPEK